MKTALSELCPHKGDEAKCSLITFIGMVTDMVIVDRTGKSSWKPFQTGVCLSTLCAVELRQMYIAERQFNFLMLSRLSQDALENLFSTIRLKTLITHAREYKATFRVIVLAQFSQPCRHGSYAVEDAQDLLAFLKHKGEYEKQLGEQGDTSFQSNSELCEEEEDSFLYFSEYIAYAVIHKYKLCYICKRSMIDSNKAIAELVALKCYIKEGRNPLKVSSDLLVKFLHECEELV